MKYIFALILLFLLHTDVLAQEAKTIRLSSPHAEKSEPVITGLLNEKTVKIRLMGIKLLNTSSPLFEITLNDLLLDRPIQCKIFDSTQRPPLTQCLNANEQDIALSLIEKGLAYIDRKTLRSKSLKDIYQTSEINARRHLTGEWGKLSHSNTKTISENESNGRESNSIVTILATILGPLGGMIIVSIVMYGGFQRLIKLQKYQITSAQKRDRDMRQREKFIVAASLEGETNTNRAKLDAFILIYEETLKNLRDPSKEPKYKKSGDIIHEAPALSRNVFDSNMDKIDLLEPTLVSDLTKLYTHIEPSPQYRTFEPDAPVEEVIEFVSQIIRDAESLIESIDQISGALNIIVRDKKSKQRAS